MDTFFSDLLDLKHRESFKIVCVSITVCTYVVYGAVVTAQQEEGSCCVTTGYGNDVLNLTDKQVSTT